MTRKFLHIAFNFYARPVKFEELKPAFNQALDWVTYAPNCWIVMTSSDAEIWYRRLKPLLHDEDSMLICEINMAEALVGYLPGFAWEWIRKNTDQPINKLLALPKPDS
jgi:hypothetical protein